jgi:hypothetical protein
MKWVDLLTGVPPFTWSVASLFAAWLYDTESWTYGAAEPAAAAPGHDERPPADERVSSPP